MRRRLEQALAGVRPERRAVLLRHQSLARLLFATAGLAYLALHVPGFPHGAIAFLATAACYYAFHLAAWLQARRGRASRWIVLLAPALDVFVVSYGILLDGGVGSGVFFVYFVIVFGNAYRWGPVMLAWSQGLALAGHIGVAAALTAMHLPWDGTLWTWQAMALLAIPAYVFHLEHQRQRLAAELEHARQSLAALIERGPVPMFVFTLDAADIPQVRFANEASARLAGSAPESLVGASPEAFVLQEDAPELLAFCHRLARNQNRRQGPLLCVRSRSEGHGRPAKLLCAGIPLRLDDRPGGAVYMLDITAHEEYERLLRTGAERERIFALLGGMLHEFRNLLTRIMGEAEILCMEAPSERSRHTAALIVEAAEEGAEHLNRILARMRRTTGNLRETGRPPTAEDIEEMVATARLQAPSRIRVHAELPEELPMLALTRSEMEQVLFNLLSNAIAAIRDEGEIHVHGRIVQRHGRPVLQLSVRDTGCGIPEEALARIFTPFWTTRAKEGGTGLGLAVVRSIVERVGGEVRVHSQPGRGTTFTLEVPTRGEVVQFPGEKTDSVAAGERQPYLGKVLVADDHAEVRVVLQAMLRRAGARELVLAGNGEEAWNLFAQAPETFDCVVTDLCMPFMDGTTLVARIRQARGDLPIVLLTAHADEAEKIEQARRQGAAVVWKPLSYGVLLEAIGTAQTLAASARAEKSA